MSSIINSWGFLFVRTLHCFSETTDLGVLSHPVHIDEFLLMIKLYMSGILLASGDWHDVLF